MTLKNYFYITNIVFSLTFSHLHASGSAAAAAATVSVSSSAAEAGGLVERLASISPELALLHTHYPLTTRGVEHLPSRDILSLMRRASWKFAGTKGMTYADFRGLSAYYLDTIDRYVAGIRTDAKPDLEPVKRSILEDIALYRGGDLRRLSHPNIWEAIAIRSLILASTSVPESADEAEVRQLFQSIPYTKKYFAALHETPKTMLSDHEPRVPAWQHSTVACLINDDPDVRGSDRGYRPWIPDAAYASMDDVFHPYRESGTFNRLQKLLLPGAEKFGLGFGLWAVLNGYAPISLPYRSVNAHRLGMSPLWTAAHDGVHALFDPHRAAEDAVRSIHQHLMFAKLDLDYLQWIPRVSAIVVRRALGIRDISQRVFSVASREFDAAMRSAATPDEKLQAKRNLNSVLAPLFLLYHERAEPSVTTLLKALPLADLYKTMIAHASAQDEESLDAMDPLHTDPVTGASSLSEDERRDLLLQQNDRFQPMKLADLRDYFAEVSFASSPFAYSVKGTFKSSGSEFEAQIDTLRGKWVGKLDENDLLSVVGLAVNAGDVHVLRQRIIDRNQARIAALASEGQGDAWDRLLSVRVDDSHMTLFGDAKDRRAFAGAFIKTVNERETAMFQRFQDWLSAHPEVFPASRDGDEAALTKLVEGLHKFSYESPEDYARRQSQALRILKGCTEEAPEGVRKH